MHYYNNFIEINDNSPVGTLEHPLKTASIIRNLISQYQEMQNNFCTDVCASALIAEILSICLADTIRNQEKHCPSPPEYIINICDYIALHYADKLSLDFLSDTFFLNKFYLQKQFKKYVGKSPNAYQNELRLNAAKEYLRKSSLSIHDIAFKLGFESNSYFIRLFKEAEGFTPLQYRRHWNGSGIISSK